ncbi:MAG: PKD domain-containing protein [bacterium]
MKRRVIYIIPAILIAIAACTVEYPNASFTVSSNVPEAGEYLQFHNHSYNADYYEWDFGDGTYSRAINPSHVYTEPGTYYVTLSAFSPDSKLAVTHQTITVLYPTTLVVEVLEYYNEYPVSNASIILYPTLDDWENETYMITEEYTNHAGVAVFENLRKKSYFIDVWEEFHNNYLLAGEDIDFIMTEPLFPNEVNYFTAWVDYIPMEKKSRNLKKTARIIKMERKKSDKNK